MDIYGYSDTSHADSALPVRRSAGMASYMYTNTVATCIKPLALRGAQYRFRLTKSSLGKLKVLGLIRKTRK